MSRTALALALTLAALGTTAGAQTYPGPTEPPRTLDPAALRTQAADREIHERFTRGFAAEERGDWNAAAAAFTRIVALDPPEPRGSTARYDLALAEVQLGHTARAIELLEAALHRDPGFAAAAANLVALLARGDDVARARAAAERFMAIAPQSLRARYERGVLALRAGDLSAARRDFRALIDRQPDWAVAHYDLAVVELREGRDEAARAELDRALALAPGYARARFALGSVLLRSGRRAEARTAFARAAQDASDDALRALATNLRDQL